MKTITDSIKFQKQRQFMLVLPLLVFPFITLMFWALGGGQGQVEAKDTEHSGFNFTLPEAIIKDEGLLDKMSYYKRAESDSAKLKQLIRNDPYYQKLSEVFIQDTTSAAGEVIPVVDITPDLSKINPPTTVKDSEALVTEKLEQLHKVLNKQVVSSPPRNKTTIDLVPGVGKFDHSQMEKLEGIIADMAEPRVADPEMDQLNALLEKVLDIQHPERIKNKLSQLAEDEAEKTYKVTPETGEASIHWFGYDSASQKPMNYQNFSSAEEYFYTSYDEQEREAVSNAISAMIAEEQTVINGSTVKLMLLEDMYVNEQLIPRYTCIYGIASLNGERLQIKINNIRVTNSIFPVTISVFDLDGMAGIYIPGAATRDVAKESAAQTLQNVTLGSPGFNLGTQLATAGIEAGKKLFRKKIKEVKVTLTEGYQILLQNAQSGI